MLRKLRKKQLFAEKKASKKWRRRRKWLVDGPFVEEKVARCGTLSVEERVGGGGERCGGRSKEGEEEETSMKFGRREGEE